MARIPMYEGAPLLDAGNVSFTPARFPVQGETATSRALQGLAAQVGDTLFGIIERRREQREQTTLVDMENEMNLRTLEFEKYAENNKSDDKLATYEPKANELVDTIRQKYEGVGSAEFQNRVRQSLNRFQTNLISKAFATEVSQGSQNLGDKLDTARNYAFASRDFGGYRKLLDDVKGSTLFSDEYKQRAEQDFVDLQRRAELEDSNEAINNFVLMRDFDSAREEIKRLGDIKALTKDQVNDKLTELAYKAENAAKIQDIETLILTDPAAAKEALAQERMQFDATQTKDQTSIQPSLIEWVKDKEGYSEKAYQDGDQISVGYGTKANSADEVIGRDEAEKRLTSELEEAAKFVDAKGLALNPNQRSALISYAYNTGPGGLDRLVTSINGDLTKLPEALRNGIKTSKGKYLRGLEERRKAEAALAAKPYSPTADATTGRVPLPKADLAVLSEKVQGRLVEKANEEARNLELKLNLGKLNDIAVFETALRNAKYMSDDQKDAFRIQRRALNDKSLINAQPVVAGLIDDITTYNNLVRQAEDKGQAYDSNDLIRMMLIKKIEQTTDGGISTRLKEDLDSIKTNRENRDKYKRKSEALRLLKENVIQPPQLTQEVAPAGAMRSFFENLGIVSPKQRGQVPLFKKEKGYTADGKEYEKFETPMFKPLTPEQKQKMEVDFEILTDGLDNYMSDPTKTSDDAINWLNSQPKYLEYLRLRSTSQPPPTTGGTSTSGSSAAPSATEKASKLDQAKAKLGLGR